MQLLKSGNGLFRIMQAMPKIKHKHKRLHVRLYANGGGIASPPPAENPDDEPSPYNDPILRKYYRIEPGAISYKRNALDTLFYKSDIPLSGQELQFICKSKKLDLRCGNDIVLLRINKDEWDATGMMWDSLAELLTDWAAEVLVREGIPPIVNNPILFDEHGYVELPLKVRRANIDESDDEDGDGGTIIDWIDHA
jgi:hypothetical protein